MELLVDNGLIKPKLLENLMHEANELLAIIIASAKTVRRRSVQS